MLNSKSNDAHHKDVGCVGFAAVLVAMMILSPMTVPAKDLPLAICFLLIFGASISIPLLIDGRRRQDKLCRIWSELARDVGLSFNPGSRSFFWNYNPPSLGGKYRGRFISIAKVVESCGGEYAVSSVHTKISLLVINPANFLLTVRDKGLLAKVLRRKGVVSGDKHFDRQFTVEGSPREFVQRAVMLIVGQSGLMLNRPQQVIMLTEYPFQWRTWSRPSIEFKGSGLVCYQSGILADVKLQTAFLDLLCDLAELAEAMMRQVATTASATRLQDHETTGLLD